MHRRKKQSGHRIIEIRIKSEEDLLGLLKAPIVENESNKFYGFKKEIENNATPYSRILPRFYLYQNNKVYVDYHSSSCNAERHGSQTIIELIIHDDISLYDKYLIEDDIPIDHYKIGLVYILNMGINIKNCSLCKYSRPGMNRPLFCCMSKKYGTPQEPQPEFAAKCQYYNPYKTISIVKKILPHIPIMKIEKMNKQENN